MGRILTNRYNFLFEKKRVKAAFSFMKDVYRSGKSRELVSFTVWELMHRLRIFPDKEYLNFNKTKPLSLDNVRLIDQDFGEEIERSFKSRGLNLIKTDHNWKLLFINEDKELFGCLYPDDKDLYKTVNNGKSITFIEKFPEKIKSIYISSQNTIFVCIPGAVYKSSDNGVSFRKSLDLGSSVSFFRHNNGMTETPNKTLIIGEYGNIWENNTWRKLAYLYYSSDEGETWERSDFLIRQGINKHVHLVKYSKLLNRIVMADGDNHKKLWISDPLNSSDEMNFKWNPVNKFHIQMGGYTSVIESDGKILFGTDYQGGTNFIVETENGEKFTKGIVPDPYRRSPIDNMVQRKSKNGNEIWANLPYSTPGTKCMLMYTTNGGKNWINVIEYSRDSHKIWLISSANDAADELYISIDDLKNSERIVYKVSDHS